jgi:hypothetical protein
MPRTTLPDSLKYSFAAIVAASVATTIHHVFRLGLHVLPMFAIISLMPVVAFLMYRRSGQRLYLYGYGLASSFIFAWFGFVDGFLDHVLKALGIQNVTFLEGGDVPVVETVFSLWSTEASNAFYEGTGIITFIASAVAVYYTYRPLHRTPREAQTVSA